MTTLVKSILRFLKWVLLKIAIPTVTSLAIAVLIAYVLAEKYKLENPFLSLVTNRPYRVLLAGTGSMYPTLYWDEKQGGLENYDKALAENIDRVRPGMVYRVNIDPQTLGPKINVDPNTISALSFSYPGVGFGDIVSFTDPIKKESLIKRVIGLPGDKIQIRDGFVIRNSKTLHEPYTFKPRSTFGGKSIQECKEVTVPNDSIMALGDNRKVSMDSRSELGFVKLANIEFVLPFSKQDALKKTWRTIANDEFESNKVTLNATEFIKKVNEIRTGLNLGELKILPKLTESTTTRANFILDTDNYNTKNKEGKSYATEAMNKAGYDNILTAEYLVQGYLDENDLLTLRLESKELNNLLTEKDYTDVGISVVNKDVYGCPTQVTVMHLGGYIPAEYSKEMQDSWTNAATKTLEAARTWKEARGNKLYDQDELEDLLRKYETVIDISATVNNKIQNKLWLTDLDNAKISDYNKLLKEIGELSDKLNKGVKDEIKKIKEENYQKCTANWQLYVQSKEDCKQFLD